MEAFQQLGIPVDHLLDQIGSLVFVIEFDGTMRYANAYWMRVAGYPKATQLNFYHDILHPVERASVDDIMSHLADGENINNLVLAWVTADGRPIVVEGSLIPYWGERDVMLTVGVFRDVTAHRDEETELGRLFSLSKDMLGIVDFDGCFRRVNPAWQTTLGYAPEELIGKHFIEFVHPDDRQRTLQEAELRLQGEGVGAFENRYRCKDGTYKWLSWNSTSYQDSGQTYVIARDISERKSADEALHRTNAQFQALLNNSGTVIYLKDADERYTLVNPEFERLFGVPHDEVIGKGDYALFGTDVADLIRENDLRVLGTRTAMQFEERLPSGDMTHTFLSIKFPLLDPDGIPYAIGAILTDITYRKLTETQLYLRNQAIESSPTAISIADATLPDMPLIYINTAFEATTGFSALDVIGRNCRFLQADDRDQPGIFEIRQALQDERPCSVVLRNYRKDGSLFYNELSLAPIHNADGHLTHYVGISTDVTERIQAEGQIQAQNEALVKANRALAIARKQAEDATRLKSQFLATMSHELRTPLNAIIGYTEIQLAGMTGELTEEQSDYQTRVLANAEHLLNLINDVLDIAKIEAGRLEIVQKPFDLRQWMQEVVVQTKGLADAKGLKFMSSVDERMPQSIVGDPARIKQVVINLISNAVKFTDTGHVRVQVRKHGRDAWKLLVEDSGAGIPPHMQETIFEEFRQVDSSSQRKQGGTGLGLSIVRKLSLMMGGNIRLQSQLGQGSVFTIILPLMENHEAVHPEADQETTYD